MTTLLGSLTNRIVLASALLTVLSLATAFFVINRAVTRQAEAELQDDLKDTSALVDEYRAMQVRQLAQQARIVADLPKFKAAVELDHPPTLQPLAEDYRQQLAADLFIVTNRRGRVLSAVGATIAPDLGAAEAVVAALRREEQSSFWPGDEGLLQAVTVPVWIDRTFPEVLGTLTVGIRLDAGFAEHFKSLTGSDLAFRVGDLAWPGTLPGTHVAALQRISGDRTMGRIGIGAEEYGVLGVPLTARIPLDATAAPLPPAESGAPLALVLKSRSERLRVLGSLRGALLVTAVVSILFATLLSYPLARTITRPLDAITAAMRDMAATGDLRRRITPAASRRWADEDAQLLASTFDTMTDSLAAFQREASQRERLSSLGRLATVVAHEIRNPLMIIKAALRTLRRQESESGQHRGAINDIDGEIIRLDRLADEVLDFARPIRFTLDQASLRSICDSAAAAARAGIGGPDIEVAWRTEDTPLVTDGERVRLALVNVLVNAMNAVQEREEPVPGGLPPVVFTVGPRSGDHVSLSIRDRGRGIPPGDLPRIFEPFFTTRRTGSGIGLAITRNVIEGLGGRIAATSEVGEGTEIRIELPLDARRSMAVPA